MFPTPALQPLGQGDMRDIGREGSEGGAGLVPPPREGEAEYSSGRWGGWQWLNHRLCRTPSGQRWAWDICSWGTTEARACGTSAASVAARCLWLPSFLIVFCPSTGQVRCSWPAWLPRTPGSQGDVMPPFCPLLIVLSLTSDPRRHRLAKCGVP